jgi:hypothetical protein
MVARVAQILEDGDSGDLRHEFLEQLQLSSNNLGGDGRQPGDIATGLRERRTHSQQDR